MKIVGILSMLVLAFGTQQSAEAAPAEPSGDYIAGALTLRFDAGGAMQLRKGDKTLVDGRYAVTGDHITLTDESGPMACAAAQARGEYRWTLVGDTLTFALIDDPCKGRAGDLPQPWKRAK